jgi:3,4-dihydroxy 2-butanone 4-phosphate synthase/GTP cyclohydrolase II
MTKGGDFMTRPHALAQALEALRRGHMVVLVDDEDRENEGDLVMAAQAATPEKVNFILREARGLLCAPLPASRARSLGLAPMTTHATEPFGTAFTVSLDAREGVTTGISAYDRSVTLRRLADPTSTAQDFVYPGHIFPLEARPGGVLERAGHTEATVDLLRLAGLEPVGAICEILAEDGRMARWPQLVAFAARHGLPLLRVSDVKTYRQRTENWVDKVAEASLPTRYGHFRVVAFRERFGGQEVHLALVKGEVPDPQGPTLVRVHSECLTGDVLGSLRCDCGDQLHDALQHLEAEGRGVLLYLRQEGRGIGLGPKILAYALQDQGMDTLEANRALGYPADARDYAVAAQILRQLGIQRVRLLTNNPHKLRNLDEYGIQVEGRVPLEEPPTAFNLGYLRTKRDRFGHLLHLEPLDALAEGAWEAAAADGRPARQEDGPRRQAQP